MVGIAVSRLLMTFGHPKSGEPQTSVPTVPLCPKFIDFCEDSRERLGCHFCECIDVGIAGSEQGGDDSLPPLGEVIAMCGACFT